MGFFRQVTGAEQRGKGEESGGKRDPQRTAVQALQHLFFDGVKDVINAAGGDSSPFKHGSAGRARNGGDFSAADWEARLAAAHAEIGAAPLGGSELRDAVLRIASASDSSALLGLPAAELAQRVAERLRDEAGTRARSRDDAALDVRARRRRKRPRRERCEDSDRPRRERRHRSRE